MNKRRAVGVGLAMTLGVLPGCGKPRIETNIEKGVVMSLEETSEDNYIPFTTCNVSTDVQGNPTTYCSTTQMYVGSDDTITATVYGCKTEDGKKVVADDEYLKKHQSMPSDFPILGGPYIQEQEKEVFVTNCSADVELDYDFGETLSVGDIVLMSELYSNDI